MFIHQDNPPPGSYEVGHSYDSTQGTYFQKLLRI